MRRAAARFALVIAWLGLFSIGPVCAKLPDWAEAIAAGSPAVPEGFVRDRSRILLTEMRYQIQPDGSLLERRRLAVQALQAMESWQLGQHGTGTTGKVTLARAWHMPPGGRGRRDYSPAVDVTVGDSFLSDQKVRAIAVEGIRRGSLIFFEFEARDTPYFLSIEHRFLESGPIELARFEVDAPAGWTVRSRWLRGGGKEPELRGTSRVWELRDLPSSGSNEDEPLAPSGMDTAPLLGVQAVPAEGSTSVPATFANWTAVSSWYEKLIEGKDLATPEIQALAKSRFDEAGPGLLERVRAAAMQVRDGVRYVAVELGIGGWQPHDAAETLEHLYGDCKDKGTLFRSLLSTAGISSYPVLVNLTEAGTVSPEIPVLGFNHFVVAVPLPGDLEMPPAYAAAVVDGGDLGRLLIVDTTDDRTSIGSISAELAGKLAFVVAGAKGRLVELPSDAAAHRVERRIRVEIKGNGSQSIARASRYIGAFSGTARRGYADAAGDRELSVRRRADAIWTGADVMAYAVEPETDDGSFMETVTLQLGPPLGVRDTWDLPLFPGAEQDVERAPLARRTQPVVYTHPFTVRYETTMKHVPAGTLLPGPVERSGGGWRVTSFARQNGDTVMATCEVTLSRTRFEPADFAELRTFWSAMDSSVRQVMSIPLGSSSASP